MATMSSKVHFKLR